MYLENNLFYLATSPSISLLSASLTSNSSLLRVKSQNLRNVLERPFKLNEPIKTWTCFLVKKKTLYRRPVTYGGLTYVFLTLWWYESVCIQQKPYVEFWIWVFSWAGDTPCDPLSWCWAAAASAAPTSRVIRRENSW